MDFNPHDDTGRLFAAADRLLAMRPSDSGGLLEPNQINALFGKARTGPFGFTRDEMLEARAMLIRLGFAPSAKSLT
jgi:hypothetical protein